ncbi:pimeloyl-ACP methyl ester carboxylesterase [Actinoalloteichus hoggarensis]|uniref:Carboxylesterase A n=1 Tax=Actinoalloteichus hoggarensis TaxID=1470176 RepID=A0A221W974_9PSEU|nr:alpha/beta hydrolase [Actinoalloteichus hoggarensis]ASO21927.1 Carboxylesterase A precursor [Actinoalloteichus hoggarensis]MBB5924523.1 pimeloyl-ACP methyl ester carboxylesterase [Actinoalloteichus hoggarensis]
MPRIERTVTVLCAALAVLLTAACTVGGSERPPVPLLIDGPTEAPGDDGSDAEVPVPDLETPSGMLAWSDCTAATADRLGDAADGSAEYQCAQLVAPLEAPGMPGFGSTPLNLLRVGSGPTPLVVVDDAAGLPGTLYAARLARSLSPETLETFSLIGVDRRGTGTSFDTSCVRPQDRETVLSYDPTAATAEELRGLQTATESAAKECTLILDQLTRAFDGHRTAGDLEQLRGELGLERLNAIGRGEGAQALTTYAARFPESVGRLVLDGVPDPNLDAVGLAEEQARAAESTLDAFLSDCASGPECPLGSDPRQALDTLFADLAVQPLPTERAPLTHGLATSAILLGLADRAGWSDLADRVASAIDGQGQALAALVEPLLTSSGVDQPRFEAMMINGCNDTRDRIPPNRVAELAEEWAQRHPYFGGQAAQRLMLCSSWPIPTEEPAAPEVGGLPPTMVIATALDPVTPGLGTAKAAEALPGAVLVDWQGAGHGAVGTSTCATGVAEDFLVHGEVPEDTVVCPP